jgi:glycosyltransferase involved in cell wall biosynthesis
MPAQPLAVLCDYPEEGWPSMDLVAEMLLAHLPSAGEGAWRGERICPPFRPVFRYSPFVGRRHAAFNGDRFLNRYLFFPGHARRIAREFHLFHVADHSYAQLVHQLPPERTGVYCHDLDAFRCLFAPQQAPRPAWFRALMRHVLRGLQKASIVFYSTASVRREAEVHGLFDDDRWIHAPYGISPEFRPQDGPDATARSSRPYLLHVGSCIPRKRIDVLLDLLAEVRREFRELQLIQIGGNWTQEQLAHMKRRSIESAVSQRRGLDRHELAALYRGAALVLVPSEAEGFGLPVIEALACGASVLASDLPVLREVGGEAAVYCPVGDVSCWSATAIKMLRNAAAAPPLAARLAQAGRFTWPAHTRTILGAYQRLLTR